MSDEPNKIAVKRDGPRGWHWIARDSYDPAVHELFEPLTVEVEIEVEAPKVTVKPATADDDPAPKAAKKRGGKA